MTTKTARARAFLIANPTTSVHAAQRALGIRSAIVARARYMLERDGMRFPRECPHARR